MVNEVPVEAAPEGADCAEVGHLGADVGHRHVADELILGLEALLADSAYELAALLPVGLLHVSLHAERGFKVLEKYKGEKAREMRKCLKINTGS